MFYSSTDTICKFVPVSDDLKKQWYDSKDWQKHKEKKGKDRRGIFTPQDAKKDWKWLCSEIKNIRLELLDAPPSKGCYAVIYFIESDYQSKKLGNPIRFMVMLDKEYQAKCCEESPKGN